VDVPDYTTQETLSSSTYTFWNEWPGEHQSHHSGRRRVFSHKKPFVVIAKILWNRHSKLAIFAEAVSGCD
jgi:hypothetical protein